MIIVDDIQNIDIGQKIVNDKVLMVGSENTTVIGRPYVKGAKAIFEVEEITKDAKVYSLKTKKRKNSKRMRTIRRRIVVLRFVDIDLSEDTAKDMGISLNNSNGSVDIPPPPPSEM